MISAVYCSQAGFIGLHLNRGATQGRCAAVGTSPSYRAVAFTSRDGGISWLAARLPPDAGGLASMHCGSVGACVATGQGTILRSTNFGATWQAAAALAASSRRLPTVTAAGTSPSSRRTLPPMALACYVGACGVSEPGRRLELLACSLRVSCSASELPGLDKGAVVRSYYR